MSSRSLDLGLVAFDCKVPELGFMEIQGAGRQLRPPSFTTAPVDEFDPSEVFLVPRDREGKVQIRSVIPSESGLFLEFAEAKPLEFANRFGPLGGVGWYEVDPMDPMKQRDRDEWVGEPIAAWEGEINAIAEAVGLWAPGLRTGSAETAPPSTARVSSIRHHSEPLVDEINKRLTSDCSLTLSREITSICLRPKTLLSAIWIQFALAVRYDKHYRKCEGCGRWFELPSRGSRFEKQFCSKSCKQRTYRERQSQSRLWFLAGASFDEIAQRFGSDPDTVKQWVQRRPFTKVEQRAGKVLKNLGRNSR